MRCKRHYSDCSLERSRQYSSFKMAPRRLQRIYYPRPKHVSGGYRSECDEPNRIQRSACATAPHDRLHSEPHTHLSLSDHWQRQPIVVLQRLCRIFEHYTYVFGIISGRSVCRLSKGYAGAGYSIRSVFEPLSRLNPTHRRLMRFSTRSTYCCGLLLPSSASSGPYYGP